MERFPRGSLPPGDFPAIATVAPHAVAREAQASDDPAAKPACDLSTTCPSCGGQMQPEHAHYRCPTCGYRDSCCF
ncbi:MAG TPA: hypothetical protein VGF94_17630 [Kofleriaceae bacterium]|jgi:Zn finger protein HypA/HybF involved in hydrogenase expression